MPPWHIGYRCVREKQQQDSGSQGRLHAVPAHLVEIPFPPLHRPTPTPSSPLLFEKIASVPGRLAHFTQLELSDGPSPQLRNWQTAESLIGTLGSGGNSQILSPGRKLSGALTGESTAPQFGKRLGGPKRTDDRWELQEAGGIPGPKNLALDVRPEVRNYDCAGPSAHPSGSLPWEQDLQQSSANILPVGSGQLQCVTGPHARTKRRNPSRWFRTEFAQRSCSPPIMITLRSRLREGARRIDPERGS
jgi:hypothetical protein